MRPRFKSPGVERLKLKCDKMLSTFAFKFHLRRYDQEFTVMMSDPFMRQKFVDIYLKK